MKALIQFLKTRYSIAKIVLLISFVLCNSCSIEEAELPVKEVVIENTTEDATKFTIVSNDITVTDTGYEFDGILRAESEDGEEFDIVDGDIIIETDDAGNILRFSGRGKPIFPNIGNFAAILRDFDWKEKVWAHIEYKTGSEFKTENNTDLPLLDDVKYFHFQVLDEENDNTTFELKSKVNDQIYNFIDFYLDPDDPSFFFKLKLINPAAIIKKFGSNGITKRFFKKIKEKAESSNILNMAAPIGLTTPALNIGFSNNGKILSTSHEFRSNGYFQDIFGVSGFDERPSHFYKGFINVPIPLTKILRYTGESFVHIPEGRLIPGTNRIMPPYDWGKHLGDTGTESLDLTFTGSIDFGGKGIGAILGVLPTANTIFKTDIFNSDINMDIYTCTEQVAIGDDKTSLNFGVEGGIPIADILHPSITQWMVDRSLGGTNFFYLSVDDNIENWIMHYEFESNMPMAVLGALNTSGYLSASKEGLLIGGQITSSMLYGIMEVTNAFTGSLSTSGFEITTLVDKKIALDWFGIDFTDTELTTTISNDDVEGASVIAEGTVNLPFGIANAETRVELSHENGFEAEGTLKSNITLPNGTEVDILGGSGLTFKAWHKETGNVTDKGFTFSGEIIAPGGIGEVDVVGSIINGELNLAGSFESNVNFNSVNLYTSSGSIVISSANGGSFKIFGDFTLPSEMGSAYLSGEVTNTGFSLEGEIQSITPQLDGGHAFKFVDANGNNEVNAKISASSSTGVKVFGRINLYAFDVYVTGKINPNKTFSLNGYFNYNKDCKLKSNIFVQVRQNRVKLSGGGTVYRPRLIGSCEEKTNIEITFSPSWNTKKIGVCIGLDFCNEIS